MEAFGTKEVKVDPKGRAFFPKQFLEEREDGDGYTRTLSSFWITPGADGCLWLLDEAEWRRQQRILKVSEKVDAKTRAVQRWFFGLSERIKLDAQGRITIPDRLREFAKIGDSLTCVGVLRRIELWASEEHKAYEAKTANWQEDLEAILSGEEGPM